jgi:hypothetical protein
MIWDCLVLKKGRAGRVCDTIGGLLYIKKSEQLLLVQKSDSRIVNSSVGGDDNAQEEANLFQVEEHIRDGLRATFWTVSMFLRLVNNRRHNQVHMQDEE